MSDRKPKDVEDLVSKRLSSHQQEFKGFRASVVPGTASPSPDLSFWFVGVATDKDPVKTFEFYDVLARVEEELLASDDLDVQIVPSGVVSES